MPATAKRQFAIASIAAQIGAISLARAVAKTEHGALGRSAMVNEGNDIGGSFCRDELKHLDKERDTSRKRRAVIVVGLVRRRLSGKPGDEFCRVSNANFSNDSRPMRLDRTL